MHFYFYTTKELQIDAIYTRYRVVQFLTVSVIQIQTLVDISLRRPCRPDLLWHLLYFLLVWDWFFFSVVSLANFSMNTPKNIPSKYKSSHPKDQFWVKLLFCMNEWWMLLASWIPKKYCWDRQIPLQKSLTHPYKCFSLYI